MSLKSYSREAQKLVDLMNRVKLETKSSHTTAKKTTPIVISINNNGSVHHFHVLDFRIEFTQISPMPDVTDHVILKCSGVLKSDAEIHAEMNQVSLKFESAREGAERNGYENA